MNHGYFVPGDGGVLLVLLSPWAAANAEGGVM